MKFAKLFEREDSQVLVMIDENEDSTPQVTFYFIPEGLGVCNCAFKYSNDDEGWEKAEKFFDSILEETAFAHINKIKDHLLNNDES